jgi:hypothetical protein
MKKSQITLFIIVGIVMLIIFSLLYIMLMKGSQGKANQGVEDTKAGSALGEKYEGFMDLCIEETAKEAIYLLGMQGGAIYDYQASGTKEYQGPPGTPYGEFILPYEINEVVYNVSYGITMPVQDDFHSDPPFYPYGFTKLVRNPVEQVGPEFKNTLGNYPTNPLTPLCDYFGENSPNKQGMHFACETYDIPSPNSKDSIQEYIEDYIEDNLHYCANYSTFKELTGSEIVYGDVNTTILFADDTITIDATYPVEISIKGTDTIINLESYSVKLKTRLKQIHELASHIIEKDVNDVFFHMIRDAGLLTDCQSRTGGNEACLKEGMLIRRKVDPCLRSGLCPEKGRFDDIVYITDTKVGLGGQPYIFQFAVENRPPALDLLSESIGVSGAGYNYVTYIGHEFILDPKAYDPDDEYTTREGYMRNHYKYALWKETYDEFYKEEYCNDHRDECIAHPETAVLRDSMQTPKNWTGSAKYRNDSRSANITIEPRDRGLHSVKIEVCDSGNLCDYQVVKILVSDEPRNASTNFFDDIPNMYISLEDPYQIAFPPNIPFNVASYRIEIYDSNSNRIHEYDLTEDYLLMPEGIYTIGNIHILMGDIFDGPGDYLVKLYAYDGGGNRIWPPYGSTDGDIELRAKACLPHRNTVKPYPYSSLVDGFEDDFLADHACCSGSPDDPSEPGWGTLLGNTEICYQTVEYGCRNDPYEYPGGSGGVVTTFHDGGYSTDNNNVYSRTFTRYCGTRGNSCTGIIREDRSLVEVCTGSCMGGEMGNNRCVPEYDGTPCDETLRCSLGVGTAYISNETGIYACEGGCWNGQCNYSINCECASECGAACVSDDDYNWTDRDCDYSCGNDYAGGLGPSCVLGSSGMTTCGAPDFATATRQTITLPGDTLPRDTFIGADAGGQVSYDDVFNLTGELVPVASYCYYNQYCYVSSCSGSFGPLDFRGDHCPPAGEKRINEAIQEIYCYYNSALRCDENGACLTRDTSPFFDYRLYNSNTAFHRAATDECIYPETGSGFCASDSDGWDIIAQGPGEKPPSCSSTAVCTSSGWACP